MNKIKLTLLLILGFSLNCLAAGMGYTAEENIAYYMKPGMLDFAKKAINEGANAHHIYPGNESLLHKAASSGAFDTHYTDALHYLIDENGLDVNAQNDDGDTPLHITVTHVHGPQRVGEEFNKEELNKVEFLLSHGADVNIKNNKEESSLDLAKRLNEEWGNALQPMVDLLESYQAKKESEVTQQQLADQDLLPKDVAGIVGEFISDTNKNKPLKEK